MPVLLINDLYQSWKGPVALRVKRGGHVVFKTKQNVRLEPLGTPDESCSDMAWPEQAGPCVLEAEWRGADGKPVHSVDTTIIPRPAPADIPYCGAR